MNEPEGQRSTRSSTAASNPYTPPGTQRLPESDEGDSASTSSAPRQGSETFDDDRPITESSALQQFAASVKKNVLQKANNKISCLLEVLLPVAFIAGLIATWAATAPQSHDGASFVNASLPMLDISGIRAGFCANSTNIDGYVPCSTFPEFKHSADYVCAPSTYYELCFNATLATQLVFAWAGDWSNAKPIPNFDSMLHLMWAASAVFSNSLKNQYQSVFLALSRAGRLHFVAPDNATRQAANSIISYLGLQSPDVFQRYGLGQVFSSQGEANAYVRSVTNEGTIWGIVALNTVTGTDFDYTIELNRSAIPWTNQIRDRFASGGLGGEDFTLYYCSGFLTLQQTLNEFYFSQYKGATPPNEATGAPMPYIQWKEQVFLEFAGTLAPLLVVLSFLYPFSQQTKRIVEEKERRVREAMLIMGLGTGSFYASWIVTYAMLYFITSLLATILLKVSFTPQADPLILFFLFYFFSLSVITLSGAVSAVFSKSRLAATLSPLFFFVISVPFFVIGDSTPRSTELGLSILSPSAFAIGIDLVFSYEKANGIGSKQFADKNDTVNMVTVYVFLLFDTLWYFLAALYLDGVLPTEWGTREHPCFCFINLARWCRKGDEAEQEAKDGRDPNGAYEPDPKVKPSVMLRGLRKEFDRGRERLVAVNDLTMNLYEGQITVLLGHNGAGKTTAINLMTGMLQPTAGDCIVYGKSIKTQMRAVRQEIGFCPQHNILWPELTCREHLEYFGKLKGLSGDELDRNVVEMLTAVDLMEKIDTPSENLSGGQKRKLSVAIAFVGRSRVVFLDEPTAGMDVGARRFTWDLIRRMSVGRTIVLTTHYMDEADLLGNTIAIMSKGRLKCKGSSLFLKSRLGIGYNLTISVDHSAPTNEVAALVRGPIPTAEALPSGSGEVAFRLPMAEVPQFPAMLAMLEERGVALGVRSYGISVTTMEEVFFRIASEERKDEATVANPGESPPAEPVPETADPHAWATHRGNAPDFFRQFKALVTKRFHNIKRDRRTQCFQIVMPIASLLLAMLLTVLIKFPSLPSLRIVPSMYNDAIEVVYTNCPGWNATGVFDSPVVPVLVNASSVEAFSQLLLSEFKAHQGLRTTAFYCDKRKAGRSFLFFNASGGIHAAPEAMQEYYNAFARARGVATNLVVSSDPLVLTDRESAFVQAIQTLVVGIFIMIPFTFVPSTFVSWVIKERECKAKHLQTISGMQFTVYWVSNFVFDIASFICTEFLAIFVFLIFNRTEYIGGGEQFGAIFLLFLVYGLSGVCGSYLVSFAFDQHGSAQNVVMLANFICGFLLVLLNYFLVVIPSMASAGKVLRYIWRIVPSYCLGDGIINLASISLNASLEQSQSAFDMDVVGWDLVYMAIEFPLFALLTLIIDHPSRQKRAQQLFHQPDVLPPPIANEDADVLEERIMVETGQRGNDLVRVKNLCKVYPAAGGPKVAVKNLSFGVKPGEVFGFLGTNGAGKTTTISILCGEQLPTHGRGWICGHDVVDDAVPARTAVGYCPQFDALLDLLTAEEHLRLYAGLRNLDAAAIDDVVHSLIHAAGLDEHRQTLAVNMSGGNRRKLSVAISLVGAPMVVFLDEPSAGMDPMARRGLWDVVEAIAARCGIVLTTHHLEEVEALAHRVAIMVDGELRCIGSLQHLKHKFGSGFEMSIRVDSNRRVEDFRRFMAERFPRAVEQEFRQLKFTYALGPDTKLSETFRCIEEAKAALGVTDYSVSQTSLEQVFLRIEGDNSTE